MERWKLHKRNENNARFHFSLGEFGHWKRDKRPFVERTPWTSEHKVNEVLMWQGIFFAISVF